MQTLSSAPLRHAAVIVACLAASGGGGVLHGQGAPAAQAGAWQIARGPLATRWAAEVTPEKVLPEYPRPQLVREKWLNLNGLWDYAIRPKADAQPTTWDGKILVPFAAESALSGVMKPVGSANRLWYRRTFTPPADWSGHRLLLHFGAVDWDTTVFVNGQKMGDHRGGYDAFTFDISSGMKAGQPTEVVVSVWDPTDEGEQPRGKQVRRPRSIWYTAVTGIWQTVWVEPVLQRSIEHVRITPDPDRDRVRFEIARRGISEDNIARSSEQVDIVIKGAGGRVVAERRGVTADKPIDVPLAKATRWSPGNPFLYQVDITLRMGNAPVDRVGSYFGMRTIAVKKDAQGLNRLFLNGQPLFQMGPLDQGWWPDGLYTAPTDAALKYDLDVTKQLGFNMVRKHTKVEPARWYYWCDTIGLLVWQDMPSAFPPARDTVAQDAPAPKQSAEGHAQVERELTAMIDALWNVPSIVMWVPFNEGWGQYDTPRIAKFVKEKDPTRVVNETSGWDNHDSGDVRDVHEYPGPSMPPIEDDRVAVLGEFGGLGLVVDDHIWQRDANWGYRSYKTRQELNDQYAMRVSSLKPLIGHGLAAAVYTQTTDVEIEVNGFMTYDRAITKLDVDRVKALHESLYQPPAKTETVLPISIGSSAKDPKVLWRYTTTAPAANWFETAFSDAAWTQAEGPFGKTNEPLPAVRTPWTSEQIWLRRTFSLARVPTTPLYLLMRYDEDATVYVNGQKIAEVPGRVAHYAPVEASDALRAALKAGTNVIAVHCKQTKGDQFIDVGILASAIQAGGPGSSR